MATLVLVMLTLYLTVAPMTFVFGPRASDIISAVVAFGSQLDDGGAEFQGIVLGVLGALFIGRVIAPVPDVRNQTAVDVGSAGAAHLLAALVIDTAILVTVGVIGDPCRAGHAWFVIVLGVLAFGLAQAVDAGVTFGPKRQRRRTRNDLIATSWAIHRRAAVLHEQGTRRYRPRRRLTLLVAVTIAFSAAGGVVVPAMTYGSDFRPYVPAAAGVALAIAGWSMFWVTFLSASASPANPSRTLRGLAGAMAIATTLIPAVSAMFAPTGSEANALKAGVLLAAIIPFIHTTGLVPPQYELAAASLAVELRRYRRRRIVLLRDYYALRHRRAKSKRNTRRGSWEKRLLMALKHEHGASTKNLPKPASLQRRRPDEGPGSAAWWESAGRPKMYLPPNDHGESGA